MTEQKLIAFVGFRRSGKDTAAAALIKEGWQLVKFADALKGMLRFYLTYIGMPANHIERLIEGDLKETPTAAFCGRTSRWAMQSLGTEWGRNLIADGLWVDATMRHAGAHKKVVISDCRFANEAAAIQLNGGKIIRVNRAGVLVDSHPSETGIASLPQDFSVDNNGTVDELQQKVLQLVSSI